MPLDPTGADVEAFRSALLTFYGDERRDLPWRRDPDPYRVLVSEIMLQQTRVETVVPYFEEWMERFPDAGSLARADLEEVLRLWQGLGYYSRARNLHRAVREVEVRYGGRIPGEPSELESLPGVGPYTAGAVASIAFGVPAPAVDGNVRRVLARLKDDPTPPPARLRSWAASMVDPERPGEFNQALMELGATVCRPRSPDCGVCPVSEHCAAREQGTQENRPAPRKRARPPRVVEAVVALVDRTHGRNRVLLRRRGEDGLLGGMWEVPGVRVAAGVGPKAEAIALAATLQREVGGSDGRPELVAEMDPMDHAFSHLRVRYRPFEFRAAPTPGERAGDDELEDDAGRALRWISLDELEAVPLPAAQVRILSCLH